MVYILYISSVFLVYICYMQAHNTIYNIQHGYYSIYMQHIHILYKYSERQNLYIYIKHKYISIEYCIRNCNFHFNTLSQLLFYNVPYISSSKLILVASIYNISTLRAEESRIQVQDQLELYDETCFKRRKPDSQISRRQTYMERIQNVPHNIALSLSNTQMHRRFICFTYKHSFS